MTVATKTLPPVPEFEDGKVANDVTIICNSPIESIELLSPPDVDYYGRPNGSEGKIEVDENSPRKWKKGERPRIRITAASPTFKMRRGQWTVDGVPRGEPFDL